MRSMIIGAQWIIGFLDFQNIRIHRRPRRHFKLNIKRILPNLF